MVADAMKDAHAALLTLARLKVLGAAIFATS